MSPPRLLILLGMACGACRGLPVIAPQQVVDGPRESHWEAAAFDAHRNRLITFGGMIRHEGVFRYSGAAMEWDGQRWLITSDSTAVPPSRHAHAMVYRPGARRVMIYGGVSEPPGARTASRLCDTWEFDGTRWTRLSEAPCVTDRPAAASLVYDSRSASVLLVEGPAESPDEAPRPLRIWRWTDDKWILADSTGPRRTRAQQVAFDAARGVLVVPVFGGVDSGVWELSQRGWQRFQVSGPAARTVFGAAYDGRLKRVVITGGLRWERREWLDDAWMWDGHRWELLPLYGSSPPAARSHATLLYDPNNKRLLLLGGSGIGGRLLRELWIYDNNGWRLAR